MRVGSLTNLAIGMLMWALAGTGTASAQYDYCVNSSNPFHCGEVWMDNMLNRSRSQRPAPAPSFGALAVGVQDSSKFVFSTGFSTQGQAKAEAVKKCNARVAQGQSCKTQVWFRNACASIAWGQGGVWGASWGKPQAKAIANGVVACVAHGGKGCAERRTICSF